MGTHPHRAALASARERLALLRAAEHDHLAASPYRFAHEHDRRGGRYVVRAQVASPVPEEISRLAADVVRDLHASIDALATTLAGSPTRFPIFESLALFAQRARKAIAPMSDEAQASLEDLQPYHAIGGFQNGPLWFLRQLDADEPPRLSPSLLGGVMGVNTQRGVSLDGERVIVSGPFADGAIVASVKTKVVGNDPKLDMFFRADVALAFAAQSPGKGRPILALLGELCDHVEHAVFGALEPALAASR